LHGFSLQPHKLALPGPVRRGTAFASLPRANFRENVPFVIDFAVVDAVLFFLRLFIADELVDKRAVRM
jgi:hypothetical protein